MISICFQDKPFNITVIQACAPTSNAEEAEVELFYEDLQDLLELALKKMCFSSTHAVSRGKPSVIESLWAHASGICLWCSSLPKARLNKQAWKKVTTTAPHVSGRKLDTEETSKQKKLK